MLLRGVALLALAGRAFASINGLSKTPPMGWMSWATFFCQVDCKDHPFTCINQELYMQMADRLGILADFYVR